MKPTVVVLDPKGSGEKRIINQSDYDANPEAFTLWADYQDELLKSSTITSTEISVGKIYRIAAEAKGKKTKADARKPRRRSRKV
jgi:hypothetical protein